MKDIDLDPSHPQNDRSPTFLRTPSQAQQKSSARSEGPEGPRFVAAVSVSCSGDKSDKEESAGGFWCYVLLQTNTGLA
ncbi:hypothetical protein [Roseovarius sp. D0-M9]|uniref:hypothetical protein n=1 Tax=Roseovarius sp. D0-M9 TaxID=3127117 RepID=UPI00300FDACE